MQNIENILQEIYAIDPSLKNKEEEIKKIIYIILESKPDVQINQEFIDRLKNELRVEFSSVSKKSINWLNVFNPRLVGGLAAALIITIGAPLFINYIYKTGPIDIENTIVKNNDGSIVVGTSDGGVVTKEPVTGKVIAGFVKFGSEEKYKKYLENSEQGYYGFGGGRGITMEAMEMPAPSMAPTTMDGMKASGASTPERISETNVQVAGIDEPDILKTDGKEIYFSHSIGHYYGRSMPMPAIGVDSVGGVVEKILPPEYNQQKTHVIKAFPIEDLSKESVIDKAGDLLLSNNVLVVFEQKNIYGYDVSNPKNPSKKWNVEIDGKNSVVQARLYDGKIYLITRTDANRYNPCVIPLFKTGAGEVSIACKDIYHPIVSLAANANYHISTIDPVSGALKNGVSFLGSYDSTVYMSKGNIYIAYAYQGDFIKVVSELFKENSDIIPKEVTDKISKLATYDISDSSKMQEFEIVFRDYLSSLNNDESLRIENEMGNRAQAYFKKHKRDLMKTDIIKISIRDFSVDAMGTVPGQLLNQFSMDEYNEHLRVATTVGGGWFSFGGPQEQENDVYVLDKNLSTSGSLQGLGLNERIYSARFIQDKGYLVTFRQTDPFYVLDLSNPRKPEIKGELKIPGYSSYLHPISKDRILGVGKEGSKVKVSLFDVSSPSNPKEANTFVLEEYWSDILNTHHAFLLDDKHMVFFMPGGRGGYVLSYAEDNLVIKKAVSDINAKRALFINDYLYVVGEDKIIVFDENTWERANKLELVD